MYSAKAVANYFLDKGDDEDIAITPMKILKLVYIAHGWHLAYTDKPLIHDRIEAWEYGPVIPELYHEFKHYGHNPIKTYVYEQVPPCVTEETQTGSDDSFESNAFATIEQFLDAVWNTYKKYDAIYLSGLTHLPGTPWDIAKRTFPSTNAIINDQIIRAHYRKKVEVFDADR